MTKKTLDEDIMAPREPLDLIEDLEERLDRRFARDDREKNMLLVAVLILGAIDLVTILVLMMTV